MFFKNDNDKPTTPRKPLPALPLRDIIVFPHMVSQLFVGREKSIAALDEAMGREKEIFLAAQKSAKTNDPTPDDVFVVGTIGMISQMLRLPDGTVKVLVEGTQRARILRYTENADFFEAEIERVAYTVQVTEPLKGPVPYGAQLQIFTPANEAACGYTFKVGETYLILSRRRPEGLHTTICAGNATGESLPVTSDMRRVRALWDVLRRFRADYEKYAAHGLTEESDELAGIGMLEYLGDLPQEVVDFLGVISLGGCMTHPQELSARFGMRYVASYLLRDPEHRNMIEGGLNRIPLALADRIDGGSIMRGIDVQSVTEVDGGYEVAYLDEGRPALLQARHVVMALQAPLIEGLVRPSLPAWKRGALESIPFSAYVGMHVVFAPGTDNPWADVLAAFPADLAFNLAIHQTLQLRKGRLDREPSTIHLYSMREDADAAAGGPAREVERPQQSRIVVDREPDGARLADDPCRGGVGQACQSVGSQRDPRRVEFEHHGDLQSRRIAMHHGNGLLIDSGIDGADHPSR